MLRCGTVSLIRQWTRRHFRFYYSLLLATFTLTTNGHCVAYAIRCGLCVTKQFLGKVILTENGVWQGNSVERVSVNQSGRWPSSVGMIYYTTYMEITKKYTQVAEYNEIIL